MPSRIRWTLIFAATVLYAVIRYHVFKGVPWEQFPLYTMNKVIAVLSLVVLVSASLVRTGAERRERGRIAFGLAAMHVVMTGLLLNPDYFAKLFDAERQFTLAGGFALLFGTVAIGGMLLRTIDVRLPALGRWTLSLLLLHLAFLGGTGWFSPSHWPGLLPPLTLLSAFIAGIGLAFAFRRHTGSVGREESQTPFEPAPSEQCPAPPTKV